MKTYCWVVGVLVGSSYVVIGCGKSAVGDTAANGKMVVGFSQIGAESGWRTAETNSVQDEAKSRGIDLKFSDGQENPDNQIKAIRSFIAQKVDVILLAPKIETGWDPVLKEAKAAHIPVILLDRGIKTADESLYATEIGSDFVQEGERAGQFVVDTLKGKGNVVEIEGQTGSAAAIDRKTGFHSVVDKSPGIKVIMAQSGDFTIAGGKQVMEAFLKAQGKNINAVYCHNDDMAQGAIQAIKEAGMKPGVDMLVISVDGEKVGVEAVAKGEANYVVECNPLLGPNAFDAAKDVIAGKTLPKKLVMKDATFDKNNAAVEAPKRKY